MQVTQIGLGTIGRFFVPHLIQAGVRLTVYDKSEPRMEAARVDGARLARSLKEAAVSADAVLVSLPDPEASTAVLLGPDGLLAHLRPNTVVLDLSTVDPQTAFANEKAAAVRGVHYVEAPISGGEPLSAGTDGARNRNVTFMAGGTREAFDAAMPLMQMLGKHPMHLGPAGTGATVKLISNYMSGLHNLVAAEAFALGRACGISIDTMLRTFERTDANSYWLLNYFAPRVKSGNVSPGFSVDLQYKDLRLCEDVARLHRVAMPLNGLALQIYQVLRGSGRGQRDLVDAANLCREWAGMRAYPEDAK